MKYAVKLKAYFHDHFRDAYYDMNLKGDVTMKDTHYADSYIH